MHADNAAICPVRAATMAALSFTLNSEQAGVITAMYERSGLSFMHSNYVPEQLKQTLPLYILLSMTRCL